MKLAFRADASVLQGTGHVVRSLTLARECQAAGHEVVLISSVEGVPWLSKMIKQSDISWEDCAANTIDLKSFVQKNLDFVVFDSYLIPKEAINTVPSCIPMMAIVDHNLRGIVPTLVLDQNLGAEKFSSSETTNQLIGPNFSLVRPEIRELRRKSSSWVSTQGVPTVLVIIGGTDPTKAAVKISRMLCELDSDYQLHFVTSEDDASQISKSLPRNRDNIHATTSEIQDLLKLADIAISAAGSSSLDLTCIGVPTIYTSIASNQNKNLDAISKLKIGLTLSIDQIYERDDKELITSLERCAYDVHLRETIFSNSQKLVDGNGAKRVMHAITETLS